MSFEERVHLPCDLARWPAIRSSLEEVAAIGCERELVDRLNCVYLSVHTDCYTQVLSKCSVFDGLADFLLLVATPGERSEFMTSTLPLIVRSAIAIEDERPLSGLHFSCQQRGGSTRLSRSAVLSIVACSFLCLFPDRRHSKHSLLCAINFDHFFQNLTSPAGWAKLRCVLTYFSGVTATPPGHITFTRQLIPKEDMPLLDNWLSCDQPLCHIDVRVDGKIANAGPNTIQVAFTSRKLAGSLLAGSSHQEAVREDVMFCESPELLAGALFMQALEDNEGVTAHGHQTYSRCMGAGRYTPVSHPPIRVDAAGDLHTTVSLTDALATRRLPEGATRQYADAPLLRELNKALVAFQPSAWRPGRARHSGDEASGDDGVDDDDEFFSAIDTMTDDVCRRDVETTAVASPLADTPRGQHLCEFIDQMVRGAVCAAGECRRRHLAHCMLDRLIAEAVGGVARWRGRAGDVRGESLTDEMKALIMGLDGGGGAGVALAWQSLAGASSSCHPPPPPSSPIDAYTERLLHAALADAFTALLCENHRSAQLDAFAARMSAAAVGDAVAATRAAGRRAARRRGSLRHAASSPAAAQDLARRWSLESSTVAPSARRQPVLSVLPARRRPDAPLVADVDAFVTAVVADAFHDAYDALATGNDTATTTTTRRRRELDVMASVMSARVVRAAVRDATQHVKEKDEKQPFVTGGDDSAGRDGDAQLNALVRWLAASRAAAPSIVYYTHQNECLAELSLVCEEMTRARLSVGALVRRILLYCRRRHATATAAADSSHMSLFNFLWTTHF